MESIRSNKKAELRLAECKTNFICALSLILCPVYIEQIHRIYLLKF